METALFVLPVFACASVVVITGISLYLKIRPKFPARVNCWFCSTFTDVPYGNRNCWDCPNCEQYNGFLPDGDYNKPIPAQHDELLNHPITCATSFKKSLLHTASNKFCRNCNLNQELKVQQLATFVPTDQSRFDEEVEQYRQQLEQAYRLCQQCENILQDTLRRKKAWLLELNIKYQRTSEKYNSVRKKSVLKWPFGIFTLHCIVVILAAVLTTDPLQELCKDFLKDVDIHWLLGTDVTLSKDHYTWITVCSLTLLICCAVLSKKRFLWNCELFCGFAWIIFLACSLLEGGDYLKNNSGILNAYFKNYGDTILKAKVLLSLFTLGCSIWSAIKYLKLSSNMEYVPADKRLTASVKLQECKDSYRGEWSSSKATLSESLPRQRSEHTSVTKTKTFSNETVMPSSKPRDDSGLFELENLSIGSSSKGSGRSSPFGRKLYRADSSGNLFTNSPNGLVHRRPVISPPRLRRNITQSSWVAGGYWQTPLHSPTPPAAVYPPMYPGMEGAMGFPLSRSSSRSSGFVSQSGQSLLYGPGSNPSSRTGSQCGDYDKLSMYSEPPYHPLAAPYFSPYGFYGPPLPMYMNFNSGYPPYAISRNQPIYGNRHWCLPKPRNGVFDGYQPSANFSLPNGGVHNLSSGSNHSVKSYESEVRSFKDVPGKFAIPQSQTIFSAAKEHLFLSILFCSSLVFNALVLFCIAMGKGNIFLI